MNKRNTVGSMSMGLLDHAQQLDHSPEEQMSEQLENYEKSFIECIESAKKIYPRDFYIVVETKKEPLLKNVIRNYFVHRLTCPTPTYDNVVYKYHRSAEEVEFLWVLPDKSTYFMMRDRSLEIPADQRELLHFVLDDADGSLLRKCKLLNGEL